MVDDKGIGLVLAGGGAKGAYQVGVWQALCEMGLDRIITGMSGSSIGAINALLFSSVGLDAARQVWMEATEDVFLAPRIGLRGVWIAMCIELWVRGVLFLIRQAQGKYAAQ